MNLTYLRYVIEVQRVGSITRAAQNLFMGQPNLSKAIKELESEVGITIFKRSAKGVAPTRQGAEFLAYAQTILSQIDELESLYQPKSTGLVRLSLSVPRASYISTAFASFVSELKESEQLEICFKETNSMAATNDVSSGESDLGIIRFQDIYAPYFLSYLNDMRLIYEPLREFRMQLLMASTHPLAQMDDVPYHMLAGYIEIIHGDLQIPSLSLSDISHSAQGQLPARRIYVYERGSQFDLLSRVPGTFMWVSPMPQEILTQNHLVTRPCSLSKLLNKDYLIYRKGHAFTATEKQFLTSIKQYCELTAE